MNPEEVRELEGAISQIYAIAERFGLDPYPVHFELLPATIMYEFGAYGLPGRFSHSTHGRAYQQINPNPRRRKPRPEQPKSRRRDGRPSTPFDDLLRLGEPPPDEPADESRRFPAEP